MGGGQVPGATHPPLKRAAAPAIPAGGWSWSPRFAGAATHTTVLRFPAPVCTPMYLIVALGLGAPSDVPLCWRYHMALQPTPRCMLPAFRTTHTPP